MEEIQEKINILEEELKRKNSILKDLPPKAKRIFAINEIVQRLIDLIEPEEVCEKIVTGLSKVFKEADNILLFLFYRDKDLLLLNNSVRKGGEIIKEKKGDILDWWVLKNNRCLFIEDLLNDYRFDPSNIPAYKERNVRSIMSSPLSVGERVLGVVRVESKQANLFFLEDFRVLRVICDLGAVVLEKANIFSKIKELAITDPLTNLFLRNYFIERMEEEIKRSFLKNSRFGIGILDIDNFKKINDTYGHTVGDLVIKKIANILVKNVGNSGNIVARWGGEEFIFLIVEANKKEIKNIAEKIRKEVDNCVVGFRRKEIHFTVSLGLAVYPKDGKDSQELIISADRCLYRAKQEGKNRVCFT
ncbi:MAG: sensor domain-containing diguanylate cyclase [Candidatus Omnitrophica bacterium]|nr:sensor domain-containing diguanylate cyclase [Candidatus Omnitrophota bacterium]